MRPTHKNRSSTLRAAESVRWEWSQFSELSIETLYDLLALRQSVFIVEQNSAFVDADGLDRVAWHLIGRTDGDVVCAYARVIVPGVLGQMPVLGRVLTRSSMRGHGVGRLLVQTALSHTQSLWPELEIHAAVQSYLQSFYVQMGFIAIGQEYEIDGIPHLDMTIRPSSLDDQSGSSIVGAVSREIRSK